MEFNEVRGSYLFVWNIHRSDLINYTFMGKFGIITIAIIRLMIIHVRKWKTSRIFQNEFCVIFESISNRDFSSSDLWDQKSKKDVEYTANITEREDRIKYHPHMKHFSSLRRKVEHTIIKCKWTNDFQFCIQ